MTSSRSLVNLTATARAVVVAVISSLLVIAGPLATESKADYTSFTSYTNDEAITYNDRVCNLGDPADHLSSETAFEISSADQLWEITDCVSNSATVFFKLANDIDVSSAASAPTQSPIGFVSSALQYAFLGVLDGGNKTIHSVEMTTSSYGVGLLAHLGHATISNLAIDGSFTTTTTETVSNAKLHAAGALAIRSSGHIALISISNRASVTGHQSVGGLVGYVGNSLNVSSSRNLATISASSQYAGGLIGWAFGGSNIINNSQNTGAVSASSAVGGLVGLTRENTKIEASHNTGRVSATGNYGGGLVGRGNKETEIVTSYNTGPISASQYVGGLVGDVSGNAQISSSRNTGTVSGSRNYVGGLVGAVSGNANFLHSQNSGRVAGSRDGGSFTGVVGGLVGKVGQEVRVTSSFNAGEISSDANQVGGLVGWSEQDAFFMDSYNVGVVRANGVAGGLIGFVGNGGTGNGDLRIENSYGLTMPTGDYTTDPLAPNVVGSSTVLTSYAFSSSNLVSGSSIAQMQSAALYSGWDFNDTWGFGTCTENNGLPMLRIFAQVGSYYTSGCYTAPVPESAEAPAPAPAPAPVYSGPVIDRALTVQAGTEATFTGNRLASVTAAFVGDVQLLVVAAESQSLVLEVASSLSPGTYDLVIQSSVGTLTFQQGLTVLASSTEETKTETSAESEQVDQKLTVGTIQGFIAIYTKGYEGQKLSAKVAGKWLVVPELNESWKGNDYSRTLRPAGSGYDISVHLYIDGKFIRTEQVTTR